MVMEVQLQPTTHMLAYELSVSVGLSPRQISSANVEHDGAQVITSVETITPHHTWYKNVTGQIYDL